MDEQDTRSEDAKAADRFVKNAAMPFAEVDALWQRLAKADDIPRTREVLKRLRQPGALTDALPTSRAVRERLCLHLAMYTSKDDELGAGFRHDEALRLLADELDLEDPRRDGDAEVLGIAAGIHKRRWDDLGQLEDLRAAAALYTRGAGADLGKDAYAHINAAFLDDLLAKLGDAPQARRRNAATLRLAIVEHLVAKPHDWFNLATRVEALFGLRRYGEAAALLTVNPLQPAPWQAQTTARQLARLAHLLEPEPGALPEVCAVFEALRPGAADALLSSDVGKLGLALSGGGFRAAFYHLGVLARLAEHDLLRRIDALSCVSGGSIVGACYWLALRRRMLDPKPMDRQAYVDLVKAVIEHFRAAVGHNLRGKVQPGALKAVWRLLTRSHGAMDPEDIAPLLDEWFYRPLLPGRDPRAGPIQMDELPFNPADHDPVHTGATTFHPGRHNWARVHKVPVLVINATTVNTGHAWQFTPTWMGESPWAIHETADCVPRLEWAWYAPQAQWRMELGRAVAASAAVPGIFRPLHLKRQFATGVEVQLVDGGVHDNQGTSSLLALNCNVLLVSDACGQLMFEREPSSGLTALKDYVMRAMDALMERVRLANLADLKARQQSGRLRGLMFLHMKSGLDAGVVHRLASQHEQEISINTFTASGVRRDFQRALAELRTDLDAFSDDESAALMACGYQMAGHAIGVELQPIPGLARQRVAAQWPFAGMLAEITSDQDATPRRAELLRRFGLGRRPQL